MAGRPRRESMTSLPVTRGSFDVYLEEINRFPLLTKEEEFRLAKRLEEKGDLRSAQKLITSNLRFVVKIAYEYRNYNVRLQDLVQEGNIGLMRAVRKFSADRGYRLISYAVWWIKAYMQNYISKNQRMVRVPGGRPRLLPASLEDADIAAELPDDDAALRARASQAALRDFSLDAMVNDDGKRTFLDLVTGDQASQEEEMARAQLRNIVSEQLEAIWKVLSSKEAYILKHRILADEPKTLQQIGEKFGVSRERVRQIEQGLKTKIKRVLLESEAIDAKDFE